MNYYYFLIACIVIGLVWGIVEAKVKGIIGETKVASILSSLSKSEYRVLNNVMIPTSNIY